MKFSEQLTTWLAQLGYTHCFFVPGGNSMHLLDGARTRMSCVPFVHEMSATIAAEYFNETQKSSKAYVLLTAGPGLTHAISGIAGAYLEGRELLVIGGQVKTSDLATDGLRQRGIQEIDGTSLVKSITKYTERLLEPIDFRSLVTKIQKQFDDKPGPVFLEIPLDVQGAQVEPEITESYREVPDSRKTELSDGDLKYVISLLEEARRPILLLGGGVARDQEFISNAIDAIGIPTMTTYNGTDRLGSNSPLYFGRPNTWGMRYSNVLIAQADVIIAVGSRLGLQQTGFNFKGFAPNARIVQVDLDLTELTKGHPVIDRGVRSDGLTFLRGLAENHHWTDIDSWIDFCHEVKELLPLSEETNSSHDGFWNPYDFLLEISEVASSEDVVIPCSSGGSFTAFYQAFQNKTGQVIASDKSLASMGYGLAGAIGAALANSDKRVLHIEGDGGFSQNLQELATVSVQKLKIKSFLWCNEGYASIRMTQRNYFDGKYLGCDTSSGLGFPDWHKLGDAYGIPVVELNPGFRNEPEVMAHLKADGPALFIVKIHPEQTFFPKIMSRITPNGSMESEPLWDISPKLEENLKERVLSRATFSIE